MDMKLEVVVLLVSDVDRTRAFYEQVGCSTDTDHRAGEDFRVVSSRCRYGGSDLRK